MENWILFWEISLIVGIGAFVLLLVWVIPLGLRDIGILLQKLKADHKERIK